MPETPSALLETGGGPAGRIGPERAVSGHVPKRRGLLEDAEHVLGVVLVVGGGEQASARPEAGCGEGGEPGLHQTAFVVPGLRPRIRKVEPDLFQRGLGETGAEHLPAVAEEDPDVVESAIVDAGEEVTDPGRMDLDADVVPVRPRRRRGEEGVSPPEPELEHHRRPAPEHRHRIEHRPVPGRHSRPRRGAETETRPVAFDGPLLALGHPAGPQHP